VLNLVWISVLAIMIVAVIRAALRFGTLDRGLVIVGGILLVLGCLLPDPALGVVQPGARFVFPGILILLLAGGKADIPKGFRVLIFAFALLGLLYNSLWFRTFDTRATVLTAALAAPDVLEEPVYIVGLDWSSGSDLATKVSPSINAMSFVPLYTFSERSIPFGIFETGLLSMKDSIRSLHPEIRGSDIQSWYSSMFSSPLRFLRYRTILLFGDGEMDAAAKKMFNDLGFSTRGSAMGWSILKSPAQSRVGQ
jgi:hypothetical protein